MAGLVLGALMMVSAQVPDGDEVQLIAAQSGVPEVEIRGMLNSHLEAGIVVDLRSYLRDEGKLPPVPPSRPVAPVISRESLWDRLASCESSGNWRANSGNSYYGGTQQDMTFWRRYGGLQYAPRPDLASKAQQIAIAERGLKSQGWGAWPVCSKRLGLR